MIANEFDVLFAKKSGTDAQHLVLRGDDYAICGIGLGDKADRSATPSPVDPLCGNCRRVIENDRKSSELSSFSKKH